MNRLKKISAHRVQRAPDLFTRFLYHEIDWNQRLIIILGQRGAGKTTLLLQRMKKEQEKSVYLTLDDIYFEANRLINTIDVLAEEGVKVFILDEVHRYEHWSKDLKSAYDNYPDIRLVVTGSSLLEVSKGQADFSRRSVIYNLPGLSFREFIELEHNQKFGMISLEDILQSHREISSQVTDKTAIQDAFKNYLQYGYYPFFREGKQIYPSNLREITHLILDVDVAPLEDLTHTTVRNMKKLMFVISQSVPFKPNISKLSERMDIPRNTILKLLDILERAAVLQLLKSDRKGISYLQKPEKIYLGNTNLAYLFGNDRPDVGNLRETFFLNQIRVKHDVYASRFADFVVDEMFTFEIGGPSKTNHQIRDIPNAYIAADGIDGGSGNKIPLWLFGFLY
jgi:predicted AAA+ superfamily ATPase